MKKWIHSFVIFGSMGLGASLAQEPNVLTNCEKDEGFVQLFDGTTLKSFADNFTPYKQGINTNTTPISSSDWKYNATEKAITSGPSVPDIRGKILYRDFDLRLSYRNNGNQGIFYRITTKEFNAYETGIEVGIENDPDYVANRSAGSAYDMFAPKKKNYRVFSTGLWNDFRIVVKNDSVEHWMNGELIVSFKYHSDEWWRVFDACKFKGFKDFAMTNGNRSGPVPDGFIGFQGNHGGVWAMRSLRINSTEKVKLGAVPSCVVGVNPPKTIQPIAAKFSLQRSHNTVTVKLSGADAETIRLMSLDGREVARGKVNVGGEGVTFSGWGHPGVYMVQASTSGKVVLNDQVFLQ